MDAGPAAVGSEAFSFQAYQEALTRACYRVLLRREAEPEALASYRAGTIPAAEEARIDACLERFVASDEFREKLRGPAAAPYDGSLFPVREIVEFPRLEVLNEFRKRCQTTYLGDGAALCRVLGRFHMYVATADRGFAPHVMHTGAWEMPLTEFMVRNVRPGMRVLDVGANFGYYSLLMSELVGFDGRCTAFEPNPAAARMLRDSLSANNFGQCSEVMELALTDRDRGPTQFFIPHTEPKNAHLAAQVPEWAREIGACVDVPTRSLDELAGELGRVDFVKIDTEGAEIDVLTGMAGLLRAQRPALVVEVNASRGYDLEASLAPLVELYSGLRVVAADGFAHGVDFQTLRTTHVGKDWLVYFGP